MKPFEECPVCGGGLETKRVEKLLRGGNNMVAVNVSAQVCSLCGERLYDEGTVKVFETIRTKLAKGEFSHLKSLGNSFTVDDAWADKAVQPAG